MEMPRTPGKVVLYQISTGKRHERWPVDAREMMATGDYTYEAPEGAERPPQAPEAPPADPVPHVTQANALNAVTAAPGTAANPAPAVVPDGVEPAPAAPVVWAGKMSPENYLKRFPEGPKADLARAVLAGAE